MKAEETFVRLARLPRLDYERIREAEAGKLRCRVSVLDKLVNDKRPPSASAIGELQGQMVDLLDVEMWPESMNGSEVLDQIADTFSRYIALPNEAADMLALWCGHAHCFHAFQCSPRLNVSSPEKSCGKTTLRDVIATFVPRPLSTENLSVAVLFRIIEKHRPTILADECDAWIRDNEELRGLLNAGHRRGGRALRCEGESNEVRAFNVFAPAVLCGIGSLPGTLHDRSVVIRLERAKPGELRWRFDSRHVEREMELCRKLARWTADNFDTLKRCDPQLPETAFNRLADNWRPLFAIAEVSGGDWPKRCADAYAKLTTTDDLDAHGIGTLLLVDIAEIFGKEAKDKIPSANLVEELTALEGRPWAEWGHQRKPISPNQLANQLRRFGVSPQKIRFGEHTLQGYWREQFNEPFERYLPSTPYSKWNNGTTLGKTPVFEVEHLEGMFRSENGHFTWECSGVPPCTEGREPNVDAANTELLVLAADAREREQ